MPTLIPSAKSGHASTTWANLRSACPAPGPDAPHFAPFRHETVAEDSCDNSNPVPATYSRRYPNRVPRGKRKEPRRHVSALRVSGPTPATVCALPEGDLRVALRGTTRPD